jgi:alkanesulfonate monooxygenase SsuD/methylene tetrahydromethanopterin reductase-like flavin-dependent oxidoreductase (luciferase family)
VSSPSGECLEQLTLLTFLAGVTSTAKLLTSVMVVPHRPPVLTAKVLATIDVLSKGRLIVGCGVGWMREEFEAIGAPPYDKRGAVSDEYIRAFKELWTERQSDVCRQVLQLCQRRLRAQAVAETASAHLGWWREPGGAAPCRTARRRLVSHRQQPKVPGGTPARFADSRPASSSHAHEPAATRPSWTLPIA